MARIFAWCDSPEAPTGFGRSAKHVLYALHESGHELVQLAVNHDPAQKSAVPWELHVPTNRGEDPYGLRDLAAIVQGRRFEALWSTFDPEVPWKYAVPGTNLDALRFLHGLKESMPGFAMLGWFPVDGGPLSDMELAVLGLADLFDLSATMAPHVHELVAWTLQLKGQRPDRDAIAARLPVIPHGVELDRYRIPTPEERAAAKARMGIDPATFVVLQLERNQQRKQNYIALEVMEHLFKRSPDLRDCVLLYQHMIQDEESGGSHLGFNLPELTWRYGLRAGRDVLWPGGFVHESVLYETVYPAADAFLSVSTGEGFQYPAWEALACGIPLVVPNGDARKAWLSNVPNVHLYATDERRLVMRGGYNRRMGYPQSAEAAKALRKLVEGRGKFATTQEKREAGRRFVSQWADHRLVSSRWVRLVDEQLEKVKHERRARGVVDRHTSGEFKKPEVVLDVLPNFGLGDLVLAMPAMRAVRRGGYSTWLRTTPQLLRLAQLLDVADGYALEHGLVPPGTHTVRMADHTQPPSAAWTDPQQNRTEFIRDRLQSALTSRALERRENVPERLDLQPETARFHGAAYRQAGAQFLERFGVHPNECVGIAFESGSPHRGLPTQLALQVAERVRGFGLTPVLLGRTALGSQRVGTIDLTGQTDLLMLAALLGCFGAVVAVDSGPLYLAAAQGTPVVGCFTVVEPWARLGDWLRTEWRAVRPPKDAEHAGQRFPAGPYPKAKPGEWAQHFTADSIAGTLRDLLGDFTDTPAGEHAADADDLELPA